MSFFIEMLESRSLLSAGPIHTEFDYPAVHTASATQMEADAGTDSSTETESGADDGATGQSGSGGDNGSGTETESDTGSDSGTETDSGTGTDSGTETDSGTGTDASTTAGTTAKAQSTARANPMASVQALATTLLKLVGKYTGTIKIPGVGHNRTVNVTIGKQSAAGVFKGTLIPTADTTIHVSVSGKIAATRKFTITLVGSHSGGSINGTGSGTVSANGKTLKAAITFTQSGQSFPGTLTLQKV